MTPNHRHEGYVAAMKKAAALAMAEKRGAALNTVDASVDPGFEERLMREILQSERTRMLILAGLSGSLAIAFPLYALFK